MQKNTQPAEKRTTLDGERLAVNSIFLTIQGEGPFAGHPAVFVRLAGCNLQCPMCDTEYTARTTLHVHTISKRIAQAGMPQNPPKLVVITGGEPFRQPIANLVRHLNGLGYHVQIETNGTLFQEGMPWTISGMELPPHKRVNGQVDNPKLTIVCSPKTGAINPHLAPHIDAFKYVATAQSLEGSPDGLPMHALEHPNNGKVARPPAPWPPRESDVARPVYLQAVDEQDENANHANVQAVVASCLRYGYILCTQIHKLIGVA